MTHLYESFLFSKTKTYLIQYLNKPLWRDKHNCTVDYLLHPPIYLASRGYGEVTYEKLNK